MNFKIHHANSHRPILDFGRFQPPPRRCVRCSRAPVPSASDTARIDEAQRIADRHLGHQLRATSRDRRLIDSRCGTVTRK